MHLEQDVISRLTVIATPTADPRGAAPPQSVAASTVARLRGAFDEGLTRDVEYRLVQLRSLLRFVDSHERQIEQALREDLGRPAHEAYTGDIAATGSEIRFIARRLRSWMRPTRVPTPFFAKPGVSHIHSYPLGVALILGAWNYPLQLALIPLINAIAAGNCAIVKPSELAPATSRLLATALQAFIDPRTVAIVEGGPDAATELLAERFDCIFYTGNARVARIVMAAAARNLTPVTLELGGKSPCIVDETANLDVAARRIAWGKFYNAGQTCVAPDYVLAHESIHDALLEKIRKIIGSFYGDDPQKSPDLGRIINVRHHRRLMALLEGGGTLVTGGTGDEADRYIAPTVLRDVPADSPIMAEEIFGPLLPVLKVRNAAEAVAFVNSRPRPLALYVFSEAISSAHRIIAATTSGAAMINHVILHEMSPHLPFGGVGPSGMGAYHGRHGFDTFSHRKSVLAKPSWFDSAVLYPPYTAAKLRWIRRLI